MFTRVPRLLSLIKPNSPVRCTRHIIYVVSLHWTKRSMRDWRVGGEGILVRKAWILPGTATLLGWLPWLLILLVVLLALPCAHGEVVQVRNRGMWQMSWIPNTSHARGSNKNQRGLAGDTVRAEKRPVIIDQDHSPH
jgi:hypothetical protein